MDNLPRPRYHAVEMAFVALAWALTITLFVWHGLWIPLTSHAADYSKHWDAAVAILNGRSPYIGENLYMGFNYPMLTGFLFLYLAAFTRDGGEIPWEIGNFLFSVAGAAILAWGLRPTGAAPEHTTRGPRLVMALRSLVRRRWITCVFLLVANYQPLHRVLLASNLEPLNMMLGSLFTVLFVRRRDKAAGVVLAVFALTKLAPILILIPLVAVRRWRVVLSTLAALAVYGLFLLVTGYWRTELFLYTDVAPRIGFYWQDLSFSIHRFAATLIDPAMLRDEKAYTAFINHLNIGLMVPYLALAGWWMRMKRHDPLAMLAWGMFMVLLFTPLLEVNHFVWAAGGLFLQLYAWREGRMRDWAFVLCVLGWTGVLNMNYLLVWMSRWSSSVPPFYGQTFGLFAVLLTSTAAAFAPLPADAPDEECGAESKVNAGAATE